MAWILTIRETGSSWAGRSPITTQHETEDAARAELLSHVRHNWTEIDEDWPEDDGEAISIYFDSVMEAYTIGEVFA